MTLPPRRFTLQRRGSVVLLLLGLALWPGAAAAGDNAPKNAGSPPTKSDRPALQVGMSAEQVSACIGKPHKVKALKQKQEGVQSEVWFYSYRVPAGMRNVAIGTRDDAPYVDASGIRRMTQLPVFQQVQDYVTETTELLMVNGTLAATKRYRQASHGSF
ncbi:MAG: hypothetical protein IPL39_24335 [Opitutaceae bacterium]|nr:hypothetical protein [Opitutaceae bacterium]